MGQVGRHNPAFTHGHTAGGFSPTYHSWVGMLQRCTNPKRRSYPRYGGRGIKVDPRWLEFENFLADMGERPVGLMLEREDNDGDYTLSNCVWATRSVQNRNTCQVVQVTIDAETRPLVEWCERLSISVNTVRCRVKRYGWDYVHALTTAPRATCTGRKRKS